MVSIELAKHLISKYHHRHHLLLASVLGVMLILIFSFAPKESAHGARIQPQPINSDLLEETLAIETDNAESLETSNLFPDATDPIESQWTQVEVQSGDNLSALFTKVGLSAQDLYRVLNSNEEAKVLNKLYPGYKLSFHITEPGKLAQLQVLKSPMDGYLFTLNNNSFDVESILREPETVPVLKSGNIDDSLFMAGQRAQIPAVTIMEMADVFGGVIDFMLDPRAGDDFSILYEEKFLDGEFVGHGDIIGAQFTNQGKKHVAVRYQDQNGDVGFYNPEGESMRKAFLRNPLDVVRISSNFNLNRKHPILNTIRAHRGTDYAAPRGTPVRATSDGEVTWAARNGSFGKLVVIKHQGLFETKYAHLNEYAAGIKKGSKVRQGQVIAYVGTTGGSTGPHLHYEFLVNGVHQDWRAIVDKLPKAVAIEPSEMQHFREQTIALLEQFESHTTDEQQWKVGATTTAD
jgi:murein DD-endopeptidase MepM/ murein hydrolase activator NlpD